MLLVYRDGLSHRETAEFLDISLSAVKVRVHRGRRRLQNALQVEFGQQYRTEVKVKMVEVTVYDEEIFYATLDVRVRAKATTAEIDCRPSDATNLALRLNLPIFVAQEVMDAVVISQISSIIIPDSNNLPQRHRELPSGRPHSSLRALRVCAVNIQKDNVLFHPYFQVTHAYRDPEQR